jgi:gamma-glutamylcysteine synthetase
MMNSTAALQVNLQAGPMGEWPARVARAYRLGPTLVGDRGEFTLAARPRYGL